MGKGGHDDDEGTPYDQTLEEVEFVRSACAAAQQGDLDKLRRMLERKPFLVGAWQRSPAIATTSVSSTHSSHPRFLSWKESYHVTRHRNIYQALCPTRHRHA
jgi:hypothetical protein